MITYIEPNELMDFQKEVKTTIDELELNVEDCSRLLRECKFKQSYQDKMKKALLEDSNYKDIKNAEIIKIDRKAYDDTTMSVLEDIKKNNPKSAYDANFVFDNPVQRICDILECSMHVCTTKDVWLLSKHQTAFDDRYETPSAYFFITIIVTLIMMVTAFFKGADMIALYNDVDVNNVMVMMIYPGVCILLFYILAIVLFIKMKAGNAGLTHALKQSTLLTFQKKEKEN